MYNPDDPQIDEYGNPYDDDDEDLWYKDIICELCGKYKSECLCYNYLDNVDINKQQDCEDIL